MAEALFMESLHRYMEQLPLEAIGWLAGARDPIVGAALALMHRRPSHPWTVSGRSRRVVLPPRRAVSAFSRPRTYLALWRLQLAARLLQTTQDDYYPRAMDVGYESEAALNRAFKREFGLPPAQYRRQLAADDSGPLTASEGDSAGGNNVLHALRQLMTARRDA